MGCVDELSMCNPDNSSQLAKVKGNGKGKTLLAPRPPLGVARGPPPNALMPGAFSRSVRTGASASTADELERVRQRLRRSEQPKVRPQQAPDARAVAEKREKREQRIEVARREEAAELLARSLPMGASTESLQAKERDSAILQDACARSQLLSLACGSRSRSAPAATALLLQLSKSLSVSEASLVLERALLTQWQRTGEAPTLAVFPENFSFDKLHNVDDLVQQTSNACPDVLAPLADVCKRWGTTVVCGSLKEPLANGRVYTTSIVLGCNGHVLGAYRKRRLHNFQAQAAGDRPLVVEAPGLGKLAVLICLDAEDETLRDEVAALGARVVVNPVHIGCAGQWRIGMEQMARPLEAHSAQHGVTWLRCDFARPLGLGSSQAITPEETRVAASDRSELLFAKLPITQSAEASRAFGSIPPDAYERQEKLDNIGARCHVATLRSETASSVTALAFHSCDAGSARLLVALGNGSSASISTATRAWERGPLPERVLPALLQACLTASPLRACVDVGDKLILDATLSGEVQLLRRTASPEVGFHCICTFPVCGSPTTLALDHLGGGFAVGTSEACIHMFSFSYNRTPAKLRDLVQHHGPLASSA